MEKCTTRVPTGTVTGNKQGDLDFFENPPTYRERGARRQLRAVRMDLGWEERDQQGSSFGYDNGRAQCYR
eukprot:3035009-Ditylum_brightwellii.AAC.1